MSANPEQKFDWFHGIKIEPIDGHPGYGRIKYGCLNIIINLKTSYTNFTKILTQVDAIVKTEANEKGQKSRKSSHKIDDWTDNKRTINVLTEASKITKIDATNLTTRVRSAKNNIEVSGTYAHPILFLDFIMRLCPTFSIKLTVFIDEWTKCR